MTNDIIDMYEEEYTIFTVSIQYGKYGFCTFLNSTYCLCVVLYTHVISVCFVYSLAVD